MFKEQERFDEKWFIGDIRLGVSTIPNSGIGVFATKDIPARTVFESSPVIVVSHNTFEELNSIHDGVRHTLSDYPFAWNNGMSAIALGWGGLINHSFEPNAQWRLRTAEEHGYNALIFRTKVDIKAGEEIFIRYVWNSDRLWFVDDDAPISADSDSLRDQLMSRGSMGMQAQHFFNDVRRVQKWSDRGIDVETLGDWTKVTKKKKQGDE